MATHTANHGGFVAPERPPQGLAAFCLYDPQPGHPEWRRLQTEADAVVQRVLPRLELPQSGLAAWRRRAAAYATTARNFLINQHRLHTGREDLRPLYFIWTLLRTCNFRCVYCDDHRGQRYPELPRDGELTTEEGRQLLRIMRTGTPSLYFSGGEPTMRRDLPELTRAARDLNYFPIIINTNASIVDRLLERDAWRTWLADTDIVIVSLDGLDLETLSRMWATAHPERVIRNLLVLRALSRPLGFKLMVNTVIQPGTIAQARPVLDLANDLGIWFCPVPVNIGPAMERSLSRDPEYAALSETILKRKAQGHPISGSPRMLRRLLQAEPLACRNTLKPHVDHDGYLFWPCKASANVEPLRVNVLDFSNVASLYRWATQRIDPSGFHGRGARQCGGQCNWAQNYSTDAYAYGLQHPRSLLHEVAEFLTG